MEKQTLIAQKQFPYDGHFLSPGEVFRAIPKDAELLRRAGLAKDPVVPTHEPRRYKTQDLSPEGPEPDTEDTPKRKRQYKRRDMRPEE